MFPEDFVEFTVGFAGVFQDLLREPEHIFYDDHILHN